MDRRRLTHLPALALSALAAALAACSAGLPLPVEGDHPGPGFVEVPYPPPVVRAEEVPPQPAPGTVWVDGGWTWVNAEYGWVPGRWQAPPAEGARYARPSLVRSPNGPLYFYPGRWYRSDGWPVKDPEVRPP